KPPEGTVKPHFLRGTSSNPVHLWTWKADLESGDGTSAEEAIARGWRQPPKAQPADAHQVSAKGVWREGRWRVVMKRPLLTDDSNDVQFRPGVFTPMALNAWDGSNGEHGLIMSLSTWYFVLIEAPTPARIYFYTALAFLFAGAVGYGLVRRSENDDEPAPETKE
ncbi:MAG TPA: ethylbenzene dehydrogenase-related protein, partial [Afifellaceae bacterium]|nr:ethylbenzene dehydrogenase-related protein [Afifellaceae bacterium]